MTLCLRLSGKFLQQPGTFAICRVGGAGRNAQFHFGSLIDFAPHRQLTSDKCGSFAHPAQAIVSLKTMAGENRRIHALSVVAHAQSKLLMVIADFNFYLLRLGVMEGVAQRFGSNFVDLVTEDGMEISAPGPQPLRGMQVDDWLSRFRVPLRGCLWRAQDHCARLWKRAVLAPHPGLP